MSSGRFAQKYIYPDDRAMIEKEMRKALEILTRLILPKWNTV